MIVTKPDRSILRETLRQTRMFQSLSDGDLDALFASLRFRKLCVGEMLFEQGEPGDSMFIVCSGSLGAYVRQGDAPEVTLGTSASGEVLGEMACIDPAPRAATVAALEMSVVAELSRSTLATLRVAAPGIFSAVLGAVIQDVTRRLREVESRLAEHQSGSTPSQGPAAGDARTAPSVTPKERGGFWGFVGRLRGVG